MIAISRKQLANLRKCDPATVSRHHLPQTDGKKYDLMDPIVMAFVLAPHRADWEREQLVKKASDPSDMGMDALEEEKIREDIEWKRRQSRKLDLDHEIRKKDLVPTELIGIYLGHFAAGIRTNFLTLGNRIARGDAKLRDRIEKEVTKGIKKTLAGAAAGLRRESKSIIVALEETWTSDKE